MDDIVTVPCKCTKGCVDVHDLDAKSGGGWECPWCETWVDESVVREALDVSDAKHRHVKP